MVFIVQNCLGPNFTTTTISSGLFEAAYKFMIGNNPLCSISYLCVMPQFFFPHTLWTLCFHLPLSSLHSLAADDQQLRALELNSWQLLRLLEAQLPGLSCRSFNSDGFSDDQGLGISKCSGSMDEMFCCLYRNAKLLHSSWKLKTVSR